MFFECVYIDTCTITGYKNSKIESFVIVSRTIIYMYMEYLTLYPLITNVWDEMLVWNCPKFSGIHDPGNDKQNIKTSLLKNMPPRPQLIQRSY